MAIKTAQASVKMTQPADKGLAEAIDGIIVDLCTLSLWKRKGEPVPNDVLDDITHRATWLADRLQRMPRDG